MGRGAGDAPVSRFGRAFRSVDVAIDHLKVDQSPKVKQSRPRRISVFAPDPEQRDALVNFGIPPQPAGSLTAAPTLEASQKSDLAAWRIPELPRDHAGAMPHRVLVGTATPKVNVPTEAINRSKIPGPVRVRLHGTARVR
jgi:hypothetical protein